MCRVCGCVCMCVCVCVCVCACILYINTYTHIPCIANKTLHAHRVVTEIEHKQRMERTKLKQADKKEAVERLYRVREYERQLAVERLQDDDARTSALSDFKVST